MHDCAGSILPKEQNILVTWRIKALIIYIIIIFQSPAGCISGVLLVL